MKDQFQITLDIDQVNLVLRQLDAGPHNQVRQVFDSIIAQVNAQQQARQQEAQQAAQQMNLPDGAVA